VDKQLCLGDIIEGWGESQAHSQDILPALVLGTDDRRSGGGQVFKTLNPNRVQTGPGVPQNPATEAVKPGDQTRHGFLPSFSRNPGSFSTRL